MNRKALIIANPGEKENRETYCAGVLKDIQLYKSLLTSPQGGLWSDNEITVLERPALSRVELAIALLRFADYSFVVYCGHGYHSRKSTILALNEHEEIDSDKLRVGARKHTLILDCCRVKERPTLLLEKLMRSLAARPALHPLDCRKYFDQKLEECPTGLVVLYGCSIDETAGDDAPTGGYYSSRLVASAEEWVTSKRELDTDSRVAWFSIVQAHVEATPKVQQVSGNRQNPEIEKPRSSPYFPFAIVA